MDLGRHQVSHSFLVVPESPTPLISRDLLTKVGARIHFEPEEIKIMDKEGQPLQPAHVLTLSLADEHRLFQGDQEKGGM